MINKLNSEVPDAFQATSVTKETYLDVLEIAFNTYLPEAILSRTKIDGEYLDLQSYSRLTSVLACLISGGRMQDKKPLWEHMMTECCREVHTITRNGPSSAQIYVDFSIKEIMLSLKLMKPMTPDDKRKEWHAELGKVDPYTHYRSLIRSDEDIEGMHNINIYNMVGEYMRETEGMTDTADYFAKHWPVQLKKFDEFGMYMDPGCPVLYDLTTRCQIQLMLGYGYRGEYYEPLDANLKKAGLMTLYMQSAASELPYGGRSSQFLFNEALVAANCEYEAARYKSEGNLPLAGAFKRCGHLAILAIRRWLDASPPRHIKNLYPIESGYGTEEYAYYDKYMITMGAFLAIGYLFADDSIEELPCPAETGGYVLETSESFHKIFANAAGYSLEMDTKADRNYDATGLGRIHRSGVPTELGLSTPLTGGEKYRLRDGLHRMWSGISPGWKREDGSYQFLSDLSGRLEHELTVIHEGAERVEFSLTYRGECIEGCEALQEHYELDREGLRYRVSLVNAGDGFCLRIPLLHSNGEQQTHKELHDNWLSVELQSFRYLIKFEGQAELCGNTIFGNRNGEYVYALIHSDVPSFSVSLALMNMVGE